MIGRSLPSDSGVESPRTPSSWSKTAGSPRRCGTSTGITSAANVPSAQAAAACRWLRAAYSSAASRPMPNWRDRFSAVSIMPLIGPNRHSGWERSRPRSSRSYSATVPARLPQRVAVE